MKKLFLILCCCLPLFSLAQTQEDYEAMLVKFMEYYNSAETEKIASLFTERSRSSIERAYAKEKIMEGHKHWGKIRSFKYLGIDTTDLERVAVFRIETTTQVHALSFNLFEDGKFGTFRHSTSSPEIDEMLRNSK